MASQPYHLNERHRKAPVLPLARLLLADEIWWASPPMGAPRRV